MNTKTNKGIILIVDDTPANLGVLSDMLTSTGYSVRPAPNGRLALRAAENDPPDLILLDINMPEMNGFEVCRRLKSDDKLKSIPVLFISALTDTRDKIKAFESGGLDYITKPFQEEEVIARVTTHLQNRQLRKELETKNRVLQQEIVQRKSADEKLKRYSEQLEEMVTERTSALEKAHEEIRLKERLAVLGHFSGSISHELRNPLGTIGSSAYYLNMKLGKDDEKITQHIE